MTEKKIPTISLVRAELKAPKNQYNSFGKYWYRNVEDIYEGVKPLMVKYSSKLDTTVAISDPGPNGERLITVKAIFKKDGEEPSEGVGFAETSQHKGMNREQCYGTALSYATKYALNQLFQLDDSKDVDSMPPADTMPPQRGSGRRQTPQQKQLHDQATAVMDEAANIKHKAETTFVDSSGTSLLDLCKQSKQEGGKGPAHQRIEAWIAENPELSTSKHNFIKRIGELNIV